MTLDNILLELETLITLFLMLFTVGKIYGNRTYSAMIHFLSLFLFLPFYELLYGLLAPVFSFTGWSYLRHFICILLCCIIYTRIFVSGSQKNALSLLCIFFCLVNALKGSISILFSFIPLFAALAAVPKQICFDFFYLPALILCAFFFLKHPLKIPEPLSLKYWLVIIGYPMFLLFITQIMILQNNNSDFLSINLIFFVILGLSNITVYFLSYTIVQSYEDLHTSQIINQRLELQLDNIERSTGMIEQIRRDKHEMKNVYFYIASLCNSGEFEELTQFANTKLLHRYDANEEFNTGNTLVDFLLTQKVSEAREYSINVITNILIPQNLPIEQNDLCGLLLNLIDNAIDASKKEKNGDLHISIKEIKNYLIIKIKNYSSVNVTSLNPELKTTKGNPGNHGIGLSVVRSIVEKYNGTFNVYMESSYFVVDVMLSLI